MELEKHCLELYGEKTCIIRQTLHEVKKYEVLMMDNKNKNPMFTSSTFLYVLIPNLLKLKYTVVIVERIHGTNTSDITAVHFPERAGNLLTPVWPV
jgi:hypothetical protein